MCCSNSFVPRSQPPRSDLEICNPLWTLEQELYRKDYFFNHRLDIFFNFSFFCPQPKAEADSFICAFFLLCHLLVSRLRCDYIRSFLCREFFFCIPTDSSFRLRSIVPIVRCLGGGYCGNMVNSVFCNYIFFWQLFFFYDATKNNQSFSFGCQRGRTINYRNSSALINNCGNFCAFFLVTNNKMENKQIIE